MANFVPSNSNSKKRVKIRLKHDEIKVEYKTLNFFKRKIKYLLSYKSFLFIISGLQNRGDSFRRKDHSNCVIDQHENENITIVNNNYSDIQTFNVVVLGDEQVGKSVLISIFTASESPEDHRVVEECFGILSFKY